MSYSLGVSHLNPLAHTPPPPRELSDPVEVKSVQLAAEPWSWHDTTRRISQLVLETQKTSRVCGADETRRGEPTPEGYDGPSGRYGTVGRRSVTYHNVIFRAVRTRRKACMTSPEHRGLRVLVEDASVSVLSPGLVLHRIVAYELEQAWQGTAGQSRMASRSYHTNKSRGRLT